MDPEELKIRQQICDTGKRLFDRGMVAANDGNITVRLGEHEFLCTPTGVSKGFMTPDIICKTDENGKVTDASEGSRPSSEIKMHLQVYRERPDVRAVVHAHPKYATAFAVTGHPLNKPIMTEAVVALGCVPLAPYATPSTVEVPDSIKPYLNDFDAVLLESHGALAWSTDLESAYLKMESLEFYAELMYRSRVLGGTEGFSKKQIAKLIEVRHNMNAPGRYPADRTGGKLCYKCEKCLWDI